MNIETLAARYQSIPSHWRLAQLGEVLSAIIGGGTPSRDDASFWGGDIPWLTVKDMRTRRPAAAQEHITARAVKESATNIIPPDTVITATRVGLGKVVRVPFASAINQDLKALIACPDLDKSYLEYWIVSIATFLESIGSGTTVKGIRLETLRQLPIPLAPIAEQREIVAEIEKQFSRLDEAVANLQRVKANLKRYKASVLKAAVEGRLVETEASLAHREGLTYETGEQLLQRILEERRTSLTGPAKSSQIHSLDIDGLTVLPEGWRWTTLGQCFRVAVGATPSRKEPTYWDGDIPWVSSGEVQLGRIRHTEEHISAAGLANSSTTINPAGSVMIGMIGQGRTRGQAAILDIDAANNQNCAAIWVSRTDVPPEFVFSWLLSRYSETRSEGSGNNQQALNKRLVEQIPMPLPPLAEQIRIVAEVDRHLSIVHEVEAEVDTNLKRAQALRQATLAKAFGGGSGET